MHAIFFTVALSVGTDVAFDMAMLYMVVVHTPLHFLRVLQEETHKSTASAAIALAGSVALLPFVKPVMILTHFHQKIVVAHVVCEALRHQNSSFFRLR